MIPELLAVVAGQNDERVLPLSALVEPSEDPAEIVVHLGHQPVIRGAHALHFRHAHFGGEPKPVLEEAILGDVLDVVAQ
jgi:hypothetical protein